MATARFTRNSTPIGHQTRCAGTDANPRLSTPTGVQTRRAMQSGRQTRATDFHSSFSALYPGASKEADHRGGHSEFALSNQSRDAMSSKAEADRANQDHALCYPMVIINISDQFTRRAIQKRRKGRGLLDHGRQRATCATASIEFAQETTGAIKLKLRLCDRLQAHKPTRPTRWWVGSARELRSTSAA